MGKANYSAVRLISAEQADDQNRHYILETDMEPVYQEFSWIESDSDIDRCEHDMRDMTDGLTVIAGMLEVDRLNPHLGKRPLFAPIDAGRLMRMIVAANRMMTQLRDVEIDAQNDKLCRVGAAK